MTSFISIFFWLVCTFSLLGLSGCSQLNPRLGRAYDMLSNRLKPSSTDSRIQDEHNQELRGQKNQDAALMSKPPRSGSGVVSEMALQQHNPGTQPSGAPKDGDSQQITLDFTDTSLRTVVESIFGDYLKAPFTVSEDFKDKSVNLTLHASATRDQLLSLLQTFLESQGVRLKYADGLYILGGGDKATKAMPSPEGIGDAIGLFRFRYIEVKDFLPVARQVLSTPDRAVVIPAYNALSAVAPASEVRAIKRLAEQLDIPYFSGKHVVIYTPRYLSAKGMVAMLEQFQDQLGSTAAKPNRQFEVKDIADMERVVIVAANQDARDVVMEYINKVDSVDKNRRQVFQYSLGMQKSTELATNIASVLKQLNKDTPELTPVSDKESNSIMFVATPDEYAEIRKLIARLDQRPSAVHVNVTVAEVYLNDGLQYGVQWYLGKLGGALADISSNLATGGSAMVVRAVSNGSDNSFVVLDALASVSRFSILSNPQIIVRNGTKATITVGGDEPVVQGRVPSGTQTGGTSLAATQFTTVKTGLELEVTPGISPDGDVKMQIKLTDTRIAGYVTVGSGNDAVSQPRLSNRKLDTDLVVGDGSTIFLGGIRQTTNINDSKMIPELGEIPWLGWLFRNRNDTVNTTELIVLVTPTVIMDQQGADIVTRAILNASAELGDRADGRRHPVPKGEALLPSMNSDVSIEPIAAP